MTSPAPVNASQSSTPAPAAGAATDAMEAPAELSAVVDDLLESLSTKFASVSGDIYQKLEEMGKRLDAMEANLEAASTRSSGKKA